MFRFAKFTPRKMQQFLAMACISITVNYGVHAGTVVNIIDVETTCKDQSEEMLGELGVAPEGWRAEHSNSDGKFNIEGRWQSRNGVYIVECELPYGADLDRLELKVFQS